jgi:hypothetical protein
MYYVQKKGKKKNPTQVTQSPELCNKGTASAGPWPNHEMKAGLQPLLPLSFGFFASSLAG